MPIKNSYSSWPLLKMLSVGQILKSTLLLLVSPTRREERLRYRRRAQTSNDYFLSNHIWGKYQKLPKSPDKKRLPCRYCEKKKPLWGKIRRQENSPLTEKQLIRTQKKKKTTCTYTVLPFVTQYQPTLPSLKRILMEKWHLLQNQQRLREIFKGAFPHLI